MRMAQAIASASAASSAEWTGNVEQAFDHQLHLVFLRTAGSDDRQLYFPRCVLEYPRAHGERGAQGRPACLAELERTVGVAMHEDALDRHLIGPKLTRQLVDASENFLQALGKRLAFGTDRAAHDVGDFAEPFVSTTA